MIGVIIGRFQVDELHDGHLKLLEWVQEQSDQMVILLGSRQSPATRTHPLDYPLRELMLRNVVPNAFILPVFDTPEDDYAWSRQVDSLISGLFPIQPATLYGGRNSFIPHYHGKYPTRALDFGVDGDSGTNIRKRIGQRPIDSADFRAGVIYGLENLQPRIFQTVDVAVLKGHELLLGRKPQEAGWRLPGGFVDQRDPSLEYAAKRELMEETGLTVEGKLSYVGSYTVDDWRSRGAVDCKHMTALFTAEYSFGAPKASDDLAEVGWHDMGDLKLMERIQPVHQPLVTKIIERYF